MCVCCLASSQATLYCIIKSKKHWFFFSSTFLLLFLSLKIFNKINNKNLAFTRINNNNKKKKKKKNWCALLLSLSCRCSMRQSSDLLTLCWARATFCLLYRQLLYPRAAKRGATRPSGARIRQQMVRKKRCCNNNKEWQWRRWRHRLHSRL